MAVKRWGQCCRRRKQNHERKKIEPFFIIRNDEHIREKDEIEIS